MNNNNKVPADAADVMAQTPSQRFDLVSQQAPIFTLNSAPLPLHGDLI